MKNVKYVPVSEKMVRFASNAISTKNYKVLRRYALKQQENIIDYNIGGKEELSELNDILLDNLYNLLENTTLKSKLINEHNDYFKSSLSLITVCSSPANVFNKGVTKENEEIRDLRTSKSNDVVTQDFKKAKSAFEDEKMQKIAFWSNKLAHACSDEIKTFTEFFYGKAMDKEESDSKARKFKRRIEQAYEKFTENPEFTFRQDYVLQLIKDENFDFHTCKDADFLKLKDLMQNCSLKCRDKDHVRNFIYCNKIQRMCEVCFDIKDNAIRNIMKYLGDPSIDEEDKHIVIGRKRDVILKSRNGDSTSRLVMVNKSMYENYLEYNDSAYYTEKYIKNYAKQNDITRDEARAYLLNNAATRRIGDNENKALAINCAVSVFHGNDINLDRDIKLTGYELMEDCPPIMDSWSFDGSGVIYDISPDIKKQNVLDHLTEKQNTINLANSGRYEDRGGHKKFISDKSVNYFVSGKVKE